MFHLRNLVRGHSPRLQRDRQILESLAVNQFLKSRGAAGLVLVKAIHFIELDQYLKGSQW